MKLQRLLIITQAVDTNDKALGFFHRWIEVFAEEYQSVLVVCLSQGAHTLPGNVEVISLGKESGSSKLVQAKKFLHTIWKRRASYDSVFVHMNPIYLVLGGWAFRLLKKRVVLWYTHRHVDLKLRIGVLMADVVATVSPETMRVRTNKKMVTGHGIDTAAFDTQPVLNSPHQILVVGRIAPVKRIRECVEALAELIKQHPQATMTFIGEPGSSSDEEYKKSIVRRIEELGITDRVTWFGGVPQANLIQQYKQYGTLLSLTETGSFDKVVLEAALSGLLVCTPNTAFVESLPEECIIRDDTPLGTAHTLNILINLPTQERLNIQRQLIGYVQKEHALQGLILRLSKALSASAGER